MISGLLPLGIKAGILSTPDVDISDVKGNVYWCAPKVDDNFEDGSQEYPFFDVQKAIDLAQPGDRILMKGGTYKYDKRIEIYNKNGTEDMMIELWGYDGQAILDFSEMPYHLHKDNYQQGMRLTSSYWHLKNLDFCNASDNGLLIERFRYDEPGQPTTTKEEIMAAEDQAHHNIIEMCNFYRNSDAGVQIKNLGAYNKFINCDSYFNADVNYESPGEYYGDADGFAPKISCGTGNYFYGCRAWQNSDDGWDSFYKKSNGFPDDIVVICENCICYMNGYLENGERCQGNGNGFKMGSDEGSTNYYINRGVAVGNKSKGFDQNHNSGDMILNNCTAYNNGYADYSLGDPLAQGHVVRTTNCISLGSDNSHHFHSIDNHNELIGEREADGSLPESTFARLKEGSSYIDAGTIVEPTMYRGIPVNGIEYYGTKPDLGAYEFVPDYVTSIGKVNSECEKGISIFQATDGTIFITVESAEFSQERFNVSVYDLSGKMIASNDFGGVTTSLSLPVSAFADGSKMILLNVTSPGGFKATAKLMLR